MSAEFERDPSDSDEELSRNPGESGDEAAEVDPLPEPEAPLPLHNDAEAEARLAEVTLSFGIREVLPELLRQMQRQRQSEEIHPEVQPNPEPTENLPESHPISQGQPLQIEVKVGSTEESCKAEVERAAVAFAMTPHRTWPSCCRPLEALPPHSRPLATAESTRRELIRIIAERPENQQATKSSKFRFRLWKDKPFDPLAPRNAESSTSTSSTPWLRKMRDWANQKLSSTAKSPPKVQGITFMGGFVPINLQSSKKASEFSLSCFGRRVRRENVAKVSPSPSEDINSIEIEERVAIVNSEDPQQEEQACPPPEENQISASPSLTSAPTPLGETIAIVYTRRRIFRALSFTNFRKGRAKDTAPAPNSKSSSAKEEEEDGRD